MSATRSVELSVGQKLKNWWNQMTKQDSNVTSPSSTTKAVANAQLSNNNGVAVPASNSVNHSVTDQPTASVPNSPELAVSRKAIDLSKVHREIYKAPEFEGPLEAEYTFCASKQVDTDDSSENDPDALVLYCYVQTSANDVVFLWTKDGQEILPRKRVEIFSQRTSTQLRINYPQPSDAGSYKCEAANPEGRCETSTKVIIEPATTELPSESSDAPSPDHPREPTRINARSPIPAVNDTRRSRRRRKGKLNMTDCDSSGVVHTKEIAEEANSHQVNGEKSTNKIVLSDEDLELEDVKALPECDQPSPQNTIGASSNVLVARNLTKHKKYSVQDTGSSSDLLIKPTCSVDQPEIVLRSRTLKIFHQKCKSPIVVTDARGNRMSARPCSLMGNNSLDRSLMSNYLVRSLPMRQRHSLGSQNSPQRHTVKEIVATFEKLQSGQSLNSLAQPPTPSPHTTSLHGIRTDAQNGYFVRRNSVNFTTTQQRTTSQPRAQWVQSLVAFFNRQTQPNSDQQLPIEHSKISPSKKTQIIAKLSNVVEHTELTSDNRSRSSSDTNTPVKEITIGSIRSNPSSSGFNKDDDQSVAIHGQLTVKTLPTDSLKNLLQSEVISHEPSKNVTPSSSPATQRSVSKAVQVDSLIIWSPPILVAQQTTEASCPENLNSRPQSPKRDVQQSVEREKENLWLVNQDCTGEQFGTNSNSASFNPIRTSITQLGLHGKTSLNKASHRRMRYHQSQPADYVIQVSSDKAAVKSRPEWINRVTALFTKPSGSSYTKRSDVRRLSAPAFTQTFEIPKPINTVDNTEASAIKNIVEDFIEQVSQPQEEKSFPQNSAVLNDTTHTVAKVGNKHPDSSLSYLELQQTTESEICSKCTEKEFSEPKANCAIDDLIKSENQKLNEISHEVSTEDCSKTEDTSKRYAPKTEVSNISVSLKTEPSRSDGSPKYGASQRNSVPTVTKSSPNSQACYVRPNKTGTEQELPIRRRPTFDANLLITSEKQTAQLEKQGQKPDENVKNKEA
ncbi:hypothetical protein AHF37_10643 [Paragonimus kellicotti]|nr:hypothetical protein AHF37_10643 [Paragonimus kellicotti]